MSNYVAIRSGASALPEASVNHLAQELVKASGVNNIENDDWLVSENNPQAMSVLVAIGSGFFFGASMSYNGFSDAVNSISISSNSSGNPRIDAIVAYINKGATPNSTASNILTFAAVTGTPASSPVIPDNTAIVASIGAGNPYILLAGVRVNNGATSITNSNITDYRVDYSIAISKLFAKPNVFTYSPSASSLTTIDLSTLATNGDIYVNMPAGNITLNFTNGVAGQKFALILLQDAVGSRDITISQTTRWPDGVAPTPSGANKIDTYVFRVLDSSNLLGYIGAQNQ